MSSGLRRIAVWAAILPGLLASLPAGSDANAQPQVTTVYIVRHAERLDASPNSPLSPAGHARASTLAHVLRSERIRAVFVTEFVRTRQTGARVAAQANVTPTQYPANNPQSVANTIATQHAGERVLVVGHSNTVDDIAAALGAPGLSDLAENQFDRLFVVNRVGAAGAHLSRLRYGRDTP